MPPSCISMGNCCANERRQDPATDIDQETWYAQQSHFDSLAYRTAVRKGEYERLQNRLKKQWLDYQAPRSESLDKNKLQSTQLAQRAPKLWQGVPYVHINSALSQLFNLDESLAEQLYEEARSRARKSTHLDTSQNPARLSAFLTPSGMTAAREIVQVLACEHPSVEAGYHLPRTVQLLLWHVSTSLTFSILTELLPDPVYFLHAESDYESLHDQVLRAVMRTDLSARQYFSRTQLQAIIKDMLSGLLIGYIRAEYFGCILMVFLASGIRGIGQVAATLICSTAAAALAKVNWAVEENLKAEFQQLCLYGVDLLKILEKSKSVDLDREETAQVEVKKPQFLPNSAVVQTEEEQNRLLTYLPEDTLSLHRIYQASARVLGELYSIWQKCQEPQLLLVRIDKSTVTITQSFGLFLDRPFSDFQAGTTSQSESMLIQLSPQLQGKRHILPFSVKLSSLSDLEFLDSDGNQPFLMLSQGLKIGYQRASKAFNSPSFYEREDFRIAEVELFSVKRAGRAVS